MPIWHGIVAFQKKIINPKNAKLLCMVHNEYHKKAAYRSCIQKLRIMKIEDLIKLELCKLAYQMKENLLPKPILDLFNVNKKLHQYNTTFKNVPNIYRHKSNAYNKSLCKSLSNFNTLNQQLKNARDKFSFVNIYKIYYLENELHIL